MVPLNTGSHGENRAIALSCEPYDYTTYPLVIIYPFITTLIPLTKYLISLNSLHIHPRHIIHLILTIIRQSPSQTHLPADYPGNRVYLHPYLGGNQLPRGSYPRYLHLLILSSMPHTHFHLSPLHRPSITCQPITPVKGLFCIPTLGVASLLEAVTPTTCSTLSYLQQSLLHHICLLTSKLATVC